MRELRKASSINSALPKMNFSIQTPECTTVVNDISVCFWNLELRFLIASKNVGTPVYLKGFVCESNTQLSFVSELGEENPTSCLNASSQVGVFASKNRRTSVWNKSCMISASKSVKGWKRALFKGVPFIRLTTRIDVGNLEGFWPSRFVRRRRQSQLWLNSFLWPTSWIRSETQAPLNHSQCKCRRAFP